MLFKLFVVVVDIYWCLYCVVFCVVLMCFFLCVCFVGLCVRVVCV